jgi:hypothetical protein
MKYYNDSAYIAESFWLSEDYTSEMARQASFKVGSYKLSLSNNELKFTRDHLKVNIKDILFNYVSPEDVLNDHNFFDSSSHLKN